MASSSALVRSAAAFLAASASIFSSTGMTCKVKMSQRVSGRGEREVAKHSAQPRGVHVQGTDDQRRSALFTATPTSLHGQPDILDYSARAGCMCLMHGALAPLLASTPDPILTSNCSCSMQCISSPKPSKVASLAHIKVPSCACMHTLPVVWLTHGVHSSQSDARSIVMICKGQGTDREKRFENTDHRQRPSPALCALCLWCHQPCLARHGESIGSPPSGIQDTGPKIQHSGSSS